jgi:hypothetical protein
MYRRSVSSVVASLAGLRWYVFIAEEQPNVAVDTERHGDFSCRRKIGRNCTRTNLNAAVPYSEVRFIDVTGAA